MSEYSPRMSKVFSAPSIIFALAALITLMGCANSKKSAVAPADAQSTATSRGSSMATELTRQQAQETLYRYMKRTLQALPEGITLTNERYGGAGGGVDTCDDRIDSENSPISYYDSRDMHAPAGTDYSTLIAKVGEIWRSWGWQVREREGSDKPNRSGKSPDGYSLDIQTSFAYPPTLQGATPCFSPRFRHENVPVPTVITRDDS